MSTIYKIISEWKYFKDFIMNLSVVINTENYKNAFARDREYDGVVELTCMHKLFGSHKTGLLRLYCPKSHKHNHQLQNHRQEPNHRKYGHTRALKMNLVRIKETLTGALKPTEGVLSMLKEDITTPYSGGFCWY